MQIVSTIRTPAILLFTAAGLTATPVAADEAAQLEQHRKDATLLGFASAGTEYCENLTLLDHPKIKKAIRVLSRSQFVGSDFREANSLARRRIQKDRRGSCAFLAKTMPWYFKETSN